MLLPKGGISWKAARARLPPTRAIWVLMTRTRFLLLCALAGTILLLWHGIKSSASNWQRFDSLRRIPPSPITNPLPFLSSFYCWGPSKPPTQMTVHEQAAWARHLNTPVLFNHHAPLEINSSTIHHVDLNTIKSTPKALQNQERILILTPLKDAAPYLSKYFELLAKLTYPHHLIDLGFLVGDSTDDTLAVLAAELDRIQKRPDDVPFRSALVVQKDFGFTLSQDVADRHAFEAQGPRRKAMGRARNYLLATALKPEHAWVYWRDVDIVDSPEKIIEDFVAHDRDILVPSMDPRSNWRLLGHVC